MRTLRPASLLTWCSQCSERKQLGATVVSTHPAASPAGTVRAGTMRVLDYSTAGSAALVAAALLSGTTTLSALDNGLGARSPMGWNSWNHFGCNINESLVLEIGDFLVSSGMRQAGYNHVNLDDVRSAPPFAFRTQL